MSRGNFFSCSALTLLSPGPGALAGDFELTGRDSTFGFMAGFAIGSPSTNVLLPRRLVIASPKAMWLIWQEKTTPRQRAAQQLSDCFRVDRRCGQFVSEGRA